MPALDRLLLTGLPRGAAVLDLCCGTGHLAAALCRRGLRVTGLDGSPDMLLYAERNAPRAQFLAADARQFAVAAPFAAIVSTGDSLNHMLTTEDLAAVFSCACAALGEGGVLVFDLNMAEAFETQWHKSSTVVGEDHLLYVRGRYDKAAKLGTTDVTIFRNQDEWRRYDLSVHQRCYAQRDVKRQLESAGFGSVSAQPAAKLGLRGRLAVGRTFFRAVVR
jgi:SAM-dependent methyltransferase